MTENTEDQFDVPSDKKNQKRRSLLVHQVAPEPTDPPPRRRESKERSSQSLPSEQQYIQTTESPKSHSESVEYKDDDSHASLPVQTLIKHEPITFKSRMMETSSSNDYPPPSGHRLISESDEEDDDTHIVVKRLPCVLLPTSPIRIGWDLFILSLLVFLLVTTPLELAFAKIAEEFDTIALVIDSIFLFDVVINFITAYRPEEDEDHIEARLHKIAWRYISSWFVLDVMSCPSILLLLLTLDGLPSEFSLLKLLKGAKTLKMLKMVKVLKVLRVSKLMGNYALELEELMMRGSVQVRVKLFQLGCVVALSAHFLACFWIAVSKTSPDHTSWMFRYRDGDLDDAEYFNEWNMSEQYITAFYFAIMTMTTVGFGDIVPSSTPERLYMIAAMVVGGGMYGFIIASLASVVTSLDMNQKQYYTKMDTIHSYMSYRKFSTPLRHRVHRYFKKFYEVNSALDEKAILNDLPDNLRTEVMKLIVNESVTMSYLFRSLPDSAVTRLATLFKPAEIDDRIDYVVKRGKPGNMMFIITSGVADFTGATGVETNSSFLENKQGVLEAGDCFGELVALGMEDCYNVTVVAWDHTPLEVLVASREDILSNFSEEVLTMLRTRAFEHIVAPRKHVKKKKPKNVVGENGSGVGPFNLLQFMKYEPVQSHEDTQSQQSSQRRSILGSFGSLNFLKQSSFRGRSAFFDRDTPPSHPRVSYHSQLRTDSGAELIHKHTFKRRATTGSALFASEWLASVTEADAMNLTSPPLGDPVRRSISHASIVSSQTHSEEQGSSVDQRQHSLLYHTPPPSAVSPVHHHHHHHRGKYMGSTTRGGGGEMLPKGFSDDVFELLESVLDEIALVNQRLNQNETNLRKIGSVKKTSSASRLFNNQGPIENKLEEKTNFNARETPSSSNFTSPVTNNIVDTTPNSPSSVPSSSTTTITSQKTPHLNTPLTPISFTGNTKVSFSMRMKVEANWLPLHSYQHPYFRIIRPGTDIFKPVLSRNNSNDLPANCVVYESEVSTRNASPSWKVFSVTIENLRQSEALRWSEPIILECWDWNRDRAHALIGSHHTTLGMLRDVKEGILPHRKGERQDSPLCPQDFFLHRESEDLEVGRLFMSPCPE
jgi:hypothetical protein